MTFLPILNTKTEKEKSEMTHCKNEWFAQISITLQTRSSKMYVTLIQTSSIQKRNAAPI